MAAWPPVGSMAIAASLAVRRDLARGLGIASPRGHQAPLWMSCCGTSVPLRPAPERLLSGAPACFYGANRLASQHGGSPMDLGMTPKVKPLVEKVRAMV